MCERFYPPFVNRLSRLVSTSSSRCFLYPHLNHQHQASMTRFSHLPLPASLSTSSSCVSSLPTSRSIQSSSPSTWPNGSSRSGRSLARWVIWTRRWYSPSGGAMGWQRSTSHASQRRGRRCGRSRVSHGIWVVHIATSCIHAIRRDGDHWKVILRIRS